MSEIKITREEAIDLLQKRQEENRVIHLAVRSDKGGEQMTPSLQKF
jgi:hypothetical protein